MSRPCKHKQVNCEACREIADLRAQLKRVEVERDDFERKLEREESVHHGCDKKNAEEISDLRAQLEDKDEALEASRLASLKLARKLKAKDEELEIGANQYAGAVMECHDLKKELTAEREKREEAERLYEGVCDHVEALEQNAEDYESRVTELEGELDGLRDALETISEIDRACGSGFQMHSNARNVSVQTGGEDE